MRTIKMRMRRYHWLTGWPRKTLVLCAPSCEARHEPALQSGQALAKPDGMTRQGVGTLETRGIGSAPRSWPYNPALLRSRDRN